MPKDVKYVDPRVRFEGVEQHVDHVFYLRFLTFTASPGGIPYRVVEVKDSKAFSLNAQRRLANMQLLAMERKEFAARVTDDPSFKWLTDMTEGVLRASITAPATTGPANLKEVPVTTYRIALKDGKLTAELVKDQKSGAAAPAGVLPTWTLGILTSCCLAWFGIWFARRDSGTP